MSTDLLRQQLESFSARLSKQSGPKKQKNKDTQKGSNVVKSSRKKVKAKTIAGVALAANKKENYLDAARKQIKKESTNVNAYADFLTKLNGDENQSKRSQKKMVKLLSKKKGGDGRGAGKGAVLRKK